MKKRIYIDGCGGMLGEAIYAQFKNEYELKCTDIDVNENWLSFLDVRDFETFKKDVEDFRPDYLFHLAAITDLEYCEKNESETFLTNSSAVENAVNIANGLNIPILYISTAGIFNSQKDFYDESDQPDPQSVYARSKYKGERFVVENANQFLIGRAGWMMGGGPAKDKKFILKLMKQLKEGKKELQIINDKTGSITYTHDFAKTVKALIEKDCRGLYHCACSGQSSRMAITKELLKILKLENSVTIQEVTSEFFQQKYFATRPHSEQLLTNKLDSTGVNFMRDWKISLKEYIENYYSDYLP